MNRRPLVWLFGSALSAIILSACGRDDADEIGTGPSDSTDESTEGTDETDTDAGESSTNGGGEGGDSASTTSNTDTTDSTEGDPCSDNPDASACETCLAEACCEQLMACERSESCTCMVDCIEAGNTSVVCLLQCELDLPDLAYTQFTTCVQSMCPQECA
jgi:hypothetical protein